MRPSGRVETLLDATCSLIEDCEGEDGCPACVHSPKCGSGNRPIDKAAAAQVARLLLAREPLEAMAPPRSALQAAAEEPAESAAQAPGARVLGDEEGNTRQALPHLVALHVLACQSMAHRFVPIVILRPRRPLRVRRTDLVRLGGLEPPT